MERLPAPSPTRSRNGAQCEEVVAPVYRIAACLLGRHGRTVPSKSRTRAQLAVAPVFEVSLPRVRNRKPREAEVQHLHIAVLAHHDVLGLDVAMNDSSACAAASAWPICGPRSTPATATVALTDEGSQRAPATYSMR